jgi:hypothetical protein
MSLFSSNQSSNNSLFSESNKLTNMNNTVTQQVTTIIDNTEELFENLYDDVGIQVKNILIAFASSSNELETLLDYNNYLSLSESFKTNLDIATEENNEILNHFISLLIDSVQGVKTSLNKIKEQEHAYKILLDAYNLIQNNSSVLLEDTIHSSIEADVKPEILEYIKRGYKIIDENGNLIPIDMIVLGEIINEIY